MHINFHEFVHEIGFSSVQTKLNGRWSVSHLISPNKPNPNKSCFCLFSRMYTILVKFPEEILIHCSWFYGQPICLIRVWDSIYKLCPFDGSTYKLWSLLWGSFSPMMSVVWTAFKPWHLKWMCIVNCLVTLLSLNNFWREKKAEHKASKLMI